MAAGRCSTSAPKPPKSSNCAYLRLGQTVGLDKVASLANALGVATITANDEPDGDGYREVPVPSDIVSLPIGTKEVHPLSMAAAYATAANDGVYNAPYYVDRITDSRGRELYRHGRTEFRWCRRRRLGLVAQVLAKNVSGGTGRKARLTDQVAAGKTGTTQDNADVWFVGFTPYLSTAVWIGAPGGLETVKIRGREVFGGDYPAAIWGAFNTVYHQNRLPLPFPKPAPTRQGQTHQVPQRVRQGGDARIAATGPGCANHDDCRGEVARTGTRGRTSGACHHGAVGSPSDRHSGP